MTSLTEVYEGHEREVTSLRRLYAGTALVLLGAVLSVVAVLVATTNLFAGFVVELADWGMSDNFAVVRVAGVLAGVGVPAALVGVFIVLPASHRVRAAAAISASLCLLGVCLFWYAYPENWRYGSDQLTLEVSAIYLLGLFTAVWCLFTAIVNFKTRNDPGGMLEMNVTRHNTILAVDEDDGDDEDDEPAGAGGVGLFGISPEGDVETQTNVDDGGTADPAPVGGPATSDGGSTTADITSPLDETGPATAASDDRSRNRGREPTDRYCGNCRHFEYARSSSGIVPYCTLDGTAMDDMDDCQEWEPNRE
ncbi:DUF7139 domain-containing protein [Natronobacterium gregoryi]|uniref:Uncharacterized protein n=2 Tax=Natronobacterium gregoryi TaxID=44930 RepID=L0AJ76_NATGS|nr:hypothetical protein [Natronobacterium gregoryi]AFZ73217.1 hypothetical protein Natgr_2034 [Natronobacterium gregoryi SP2]ELY71325.1 hypothetical protein C490_05322 [Natronobacterium gregoryi SP2]PLK21624.1 hypothetical protein CYV19_03430 [Natronobacterium gregoryi SP2]SFI58179.1 hypothetical protein SAMN05443661_10247 [Natronobacterium gregoryi]